MSSYKATLVLRLAKNVFYLWYENLFQIAIFKALKKFLKNFYRSHSMQYPHFYLARISFVTVGKMLYQTAAY